MKKNHLQITTLLFFISTILTSCELIGDIFKAGVWVGIILVVGIVALIFWLISKAKK